MADKPHKKVKSQNTPKADSTGDDSGLDTFFDEFFQNNQPHQFDETENADQQRQWISDQLMWEATLGMREDETINKVITPREEAEAARQRPSTQSTPQKKTLSERERQLLRTQVSQPQAKAKPKAKPPTASPKTRAVKKSTTPPQRPQQQPQQRAQNPSRSQPGRAPQKAPQQQRTATVSASKAPVRQVKTTPSAKPAAQKPTVNKVAKTRPQEGSQPPQSNKTGKNTVKPLSKTASGQGKIRGVKSAPPPNARPSATMPKPTTQTQPVKRESDQAEEDQIIFDMDEELGRTKYFLLGKNLAITLTILIVTFTGGYYFGGGDSKDDAVAQQESASTVANSEQTANIPPKKHEPKKVTSHKAKPQPVKTPPVGNAAGNAMKNNTATVFEGKDIDIEQFEQPSASSPINSTSDSLADNDSLTNKASKAQNNTKLSTSPGGQNEAAEFTAAEPSSSPVDATPSDSITVDNTQVATSEKTQAPSEPTVGENYLQALLDKSLQSFENKQWQTLIELSNEILAIDPSTVTALTNRAAANTELGDFAAALADCNTAIKIESKNPLAINNRGYVYEKMGDFQNAILDYEKACSLGVELSCKEAKRLKNETKQ